MMRDYIAMMVRINGIPSKCFAEMCHAKKKKYNESK